MYSLLPGPNYDLPPELCAQSYDRSPIMPVSLPALEPYFETPHWKMGELHKPHMPQKAFRHGVDQLGLTLNQIRFMQAEQREQNPLQQVAYHGIQQVQAQMQAQRQDQRGFQVSRHDTAMNLSEVDQSIASLQLPSRFPVPPVSPVPTAPLAPLDAVTRYQSERMREHVAQAAGAAMIFRAIDKGVDFVVGNVAEGVVSGVQAVCSLSPLQPVCHKVHEGGAQLAQTVQTTTEKYWNGSSAEKTFQKVSAFFEEQPRTGPDSMSRVLAEQGLSPDEIANYKRDMHSITTGAGHLCVNVAGVGVITKVGKVVKTAKAAKMAKTMQVTEAAQAAQAAQVVQTAQVTQVTRAVVPTTQVSELVRKSQRSYTASIEAAKRPSVRIAKYEANMRYQQAIVQEKTLLAGPTFISKPFVKPVGFPEDIKQFYTQCTSHLISGKNLGARSGYIEKTLLSVTNGDHIVFLMSPQRHHSLIGLVNKSVRLSSEERIDFTIREALRIAKESGAKRASFAWDSAHASVASTLRNQGQTVIARGQLPVGIEETPFEIMEILLQTAKVP